MNVLLFLSFALIFHSRYGSISILCFSSCSSKTSIGQLEDLPATCSVLLYAKTLFLGLSLDENGLDNDSGTSFSYLMNETISLCVNCMYYFSVSFFRFHSFLGKATGHRDCIYSTNMYAKSSLLSVDARRTEAAGSGSAYLLRMAHSKNYIDVEWSLRFGKEEASAMNWCSG